jgi:hypothetical protein
MGGLQEEREKYVTSIELERASSTLDGAYVDEMPTISVNDMNHIFSFNRRQLQKNCQHSN